MIEISFHKTEEAEKFHEFLLNKFQVQKITEKGVPFLKKQNKVSVNFENDLESISTFKKVFYRFIMQYTFNNYFRKILQEQYYFIHEDEKQQILAIIYSVIEGHREDLCSLIDEDINITMQVEKVIDEIIDEQTSFSYDSFVKFRLRPVMEKLIQYVELSIDEYKMEQEYQMYIQTLREFLLQRSAKLEVVQLVMNEQIQFYNEFFSEIKREELTKMIDRKLLSNHPIYVDSVTIAPLLSIAPKKIFLYTSNSEEPLVRTIGNIFEERVVIHPMHHFYKLREKYFSDQSMKRKIK